MSYKKLLQFKFIETILNTPKEEFTMASYKNYKEMFFKWLFNPKFVTSS